MNRQSPTDSIGSVASVTDFVANGSFEALRLNVHYSRDSNYSILIRLVDHNSNWSGPFVYLDRSSHEFLAKSELFPGDIVVANVGANAGSVFRVPNLKSPMSLGPNAILCRPLDRGNCSQEYLYYFLSSPVGQGLISGIISGSAQPKFNKTEFRRLPILLPPLEEQRAIAEVLGALDDKIAANVALAQKLAQVAEAQYDLAAKAPDSSVLQLADLVSTQYGLTASATAGPGPRLLRVTDINKKPWIEWQSAPASDAGELDLKKYAVRAGDILVARMADPGKAAYIDEGSPKAVFASYLVRLTATSPDLALYIYYFLRSGSYQEYATGAMSGSVQMNMNARVIVGVQISIPAPAVLTRFNESVRPIRSSMGAVLRENDSLVGIRDALMPPLMSGKLRVKDAEIQVEAVV